MQMSTSSWESMMCLTNGKYSGRNILALTLGWTTLSRTRRAICLRLLTRTMEFSSSTSSTTKARKSAPLMSLITWSSTHHPSLWPGSWSPLSHAVSQAIRISYSCNFFTGHQRLLTIFCTLSWKSFLRHQRCMRFKTALIWIFLWSRFTMRSITRFTHFIDRVTPRRWM